MPCTKPPKLDKCQLSNGLSEAWTLGRHTVSRGQRSPTKTTDYPDTGRFSRLPARVSACRLNPKTPEQHLSLQTAAAQTKPNVKTSHCSDVKKKRSSTSTSRATISQRCEIFFAEIRLALQKDQCFSPIRAVLMGPMSKSWS